jgi:hypothetical protein
MTPEPLPPAKVLALARDLEKDIARAFSSSSGYSPSDLFRRLPELMPCLLHEQHGWLRLLGETPEGESLRQRLLAQFSPGPAPNLFTLIFERCGRH